ncbi:MAG: DUF1501 domain-containing protein [Epsilonproteobacteria bacterium]|nr:DUF1501 domain-containing protein [Campylobacterota bacterium]
MLERRGFIKYLTASGLFLGFPGFLNAKELNGKTLILVELKGGNDGLNTIIPYGDSLYYDLRKNISIEKNKIIPINNHIGFHPSLAKLNDIYKDGDLAILQGVGYENPNKSHFRSIEIWESASQSNEYLENGWITNVFLNNSAQNDLDGIVMGKNSLGPMFGKGIKTLDIDNPDKFIKRSKQMKNIVANNSIHDRALNYLLNVQKEIINSRELFAQKLISSKKFTNRGFSKNSFSKDMYETARVILSDFKVPVIKVSLGSFDTHSYQVNKQAKLLKIFADGLAEFKNALKENGNWDDILLVTYSEFGRRVRENASKGTDHGKANVHFAMGGKIKGGLHGKYPSLSDLDDGDLRYNLDFKSIYNAIVEDWWGYKTINRLKKYDKLTFI